jgi:hypothetical protein
MFVQLTLAEGILFIFLILFFWAYLLMSKNSLNWAVFIFVHLFMLILDVFIWSFFWSLYLVLICTTTTSHSTLP